MLEDSKKMPPKKAVFSHVPAKSRWVAGRHSASERHQLIPWLRPARRPRADRLEACGGRGDRRRDRRAAGAAAPPKAEAPPLRWRPGPARRWAGPLAPPPPAPPEALPPCPGPAPA